MQAAPNYDAQHFAACAEVGSAWIPATGTIPDIVQYAGNASTKAGLGAAVEGADGLIWPCRIASAVYPQNTRVKAALDKAQALYQQERTAGRSICRQARTSCR